MMNLNLTGKTPRKILDFYIEGFRGMTVGRRLWILILIKLAIIFLVFRLFFFHDYLGERYDTDDEKARGVATELLRRKT